MGERLMSQVDAIAEQLWQLLDDIDTLGDAMKPEHTPYFERVCQIVSKRHQLLRSDGHKLQLREPPQQRPLENKFHDHLDSCVQCRDRPFELCPKGACLLAETATLIGGKVG